MRKILLILALVVSSSAAHAFDREAFEQAWAECKAKNPGPTVQIWTNRVACVSNHPYAALGNEYDKAQLRYMIDIARKVRSGQLSGTPEQLNAYLARFDVAWNNQYKAGLQRMQNQWLAEGLANVQAYETLHPYPQVQQMYRPARPVVNCVPNGAGGAICSGQ